jgi:N-acetylglutamate synthase-like GNAT family acetyltransferase
MQKVVGSSPISRFNSWPRAKSERLRPGSNLAQVGSIIADPALEVESTQRGYLPVVADDITVRLAANPDLAWLAVNDGHLDREAIADKVARQEVFVAEMEGQPVGLLRLDYLWSTVPFVAQVRVSERCRRRGVGRALVNGAADHARGLGATFLLSSATGDEAQPQAWHEAVGFEPCGELAGINGNAVAEVFFRRAL